MRMSDESQSSRRLVRATHVAVPAKAQEDRASTRDFRGAGPGTLCLTLGLKIVGRLRQFLFGWKEIRDYLDNQRF